MTWRVILRDGRVTRDPALVTEEGGEILGVVEVDRLPEIGDRITLRDGTDVVVIGGSERITSDGWQVVVHVGSIP